jgi:hypothetical protein
MIISMGHKCTNKNAESHLCTQYLINGTIIHFLAFSAVCPPPDKIRLFKKRDGRALFSQAACFGTGQWEYLYGYVRN